MTPKTRARLSFANVVAMLALFVSLGGVSVAAVTLQRNAVRTKHIKNGAVTSPKIRNGAIKPEDLSAEARDALSLNGLSATQLIAAAGGQYFEVHQAAGTVDVETLTPQPVAHLDLPAAGSYLVTGRMPVECTYDASAGPNPDSTTPSFFVGKLQLAVGGEVLQTVSETCQAEAGKVIVIAPVWFGRHTIEITRLVTVTVPTTLEIRGLADSSLPLGIEVADAARVNATASNSLIQAVTVRTS